MGSPVMAARWRVAVVRNRRSAQMPVPMAVAPRFSVVSCGTTCSRARRSLFRKLANAWNSWTVGHRHRILQLGASDGDVVRVLVGEVVERPREFLRLFRERPDGVDQRELAGRGVGVVGRLRMVHVVVRVDEPIIAFGMPAELQRPIGDDLVHIHVRRCAGAALQHVDRELVGELAVLDVAACGDDEPCLVVVDQSELVVGFGTGAFDGRIGPHQLGMGGVRDSRDGEVTERPLRMDAPIHVFRHIHVADAVVLLTRDRVYRVIADHVAAFSRSGFPGQSSRFYSRNAMVALSANDHASVNGSGARRTGALVRPARTDILRFA